MAEVTGTVLSALLLRIRDPQGAGTSRTFARQMLSEAQRFINASVEEFTSTFVLSTKRFQQVYPITANITNAIRIIAVKDAQGIRNLDEVPWRTLAQRDRNWFRRVGIRQEEYALVGRDLLIVHPALDMDSTVTVDYIPLTALLTDDSIPTDISDDFLPLVLDLAEAILQIRMRNFSPAGVAIQRLSKRLDLATVAAALSEKSVELEEV